MGEAPVLETGGKKLTQSGAILLHLAEMTDKFAPENDHERNEALRWILFDNHKFTSYLATYRFLKAFLPQAPDANVLAFMKGRFDAAATIVDKHLASSKFMVGDKPTIADFSLAGYVYYPVEEHGYDWAKSHPHIHAWTERVRALQGWKNPYDLMPGERIKPLR
jgi:glutathione S-transferase